MALCQRDAVSDNAVSAIATGLNASVSFILQETCNRNIRTHAGIYEQYLNIEFGFILGNPDKGKQFSEYFRKNSYLCRLTN